MKNVEIYTKHYCPFCHRAKALLDAKGVSFNEYELSADEKLRDEMIERSGRKTVPQVFIDGRHIGGSDDLIEANNSGLLDELLELSEMEPA